MQDNLVASKQGSAPVCLGNDSSDLVSKLRCNSIEINFGRQTLR